ncbi:MAG: hypothetical protein JWR85_3587 [Marmoricola sp.]|nr:hypothetical protein [Marmoricola sp.]
MAKTFTATWLGDGDPSAQIITEGGVRFIKGEPTKVSEGLMHNGVHWANQIKNNPTFAVEAGEDDAPKDAGEADEIEATKKLLDEAGIKYRANASLATLRDMLAQAS